MGSENTNKMSEHLTPEAIERYVTRRAGVDEILAVAQHLDVCESCRDSAAAMVDPGDTPSPRRIPATTTEPEPEIAESSGRRDLFFWLNTIAAVIIAIALILHYV